MSRTASAMGLTGILLFSQASTSQITLGHEAKCDEQLQNHDCFRIRDPTRLIFKLMGYNPIFTDDLKDELEADTDSKSPLPLLPPSLNEIPGYTAVESISYSNLALIVTDNTEQIVPDPSQSEFDAAAQLLGRYLLKEVSEKGKTLGADAVTVKWISSAELSFPVFPETTAITLTSRGYGIEFRLLEKIPLATSGKPTVISI